MKLTPKVYEPDCTGDPASWPWVRHASAVRVIAQRPDGRCKGYRCKGSVAGVRANTHPALAPFCARCRHRGHVAIHRGYASPATVGTWLASYLHRAKGSRRLTPATPPPAPTPATKPRPRPAQGLQLN